jgi:hypothetical protein
MLDHYTTGLQSFLAIALFIARGLKGTFFPNKRSHTPSEKSICSQGKSLILKSDMNVYATSKKLRIAPSNIACSVCSV